MSRCLSGDPVVLGWANSSISMLQFTTEKSKSSNLEYIINSAHYTLINNPKKSEDAKPTYRSLFKYLRERNHEVIPALLNTQTCIQCFYSVFVHV